LEESDKVIPRLVDAIIDRKPVEDTAEITTVTQEEAAPYEKRPGEKFWVLGLPFGVTSSGTKGAFGLSLGWSYEAEHFGVGFKILGAGSPHFGAFLAGIDAPWIPLSGSWSPYFAPGIGYMFLSKDNVSGGGLGFTAEVGAEFLRLHHFRVL